MNRMQLTRALHDARSATERLDQTLAAAETTDPARQSDTLHTLTTDAALQAERLTCRLRHLVYRSGAMPQQGYLRQAAAEVGVKVEVGEGRVTVIFPELLPNRKRSEHREYLAALVAQALLDANERHPLPRFEQCTLCVVHYFAPKHWMEGVLPDYDNIELKAVQDVLASLTMVDDSMRYCDRFETVGIAEQSHTEFLLLPERPLRSKIVRDLRQIPQEGSEP